MSIDPSTDNTDIQYGSVTSGDNHTVIYDSRDAHPVTDDTHGSVNVDSAFNEPGY